MTAVAGTTTDNDAAARLVLAALDPGPFGQTSEPGPAWAIRRSSLFEAEHHLEEAARIFEHFDEAGLLDDTNALLDLLLERLSDRQEEAAVTIEVQL
jgi:hypothetical protein